MPRRRIALQAALPLAAAALAGGPVRAQGAAAPGTPGSASAAESRPLFAAEIRTGPAWDAARPAQEQAHFREHSAHLRRLRDEGHLLVGARYADKGLLLVAAAGAAEAHALFDADPSIRAGVLRFELHPLAVFYGGCVTPARRRG
jgi:uncharacterized protein YciI